MESDSEEYWSAVSDRQEDEGKTMPAWFDQSKEPLGWMPNGTPIFYDGTCRDPPHGMRRNLRMYPFPGYSEGESESGSDGSDAPQIVDREATKRYYPAQKRRPLSEPPMLDYDDFVENTLPSDLRFSKLFPNNLEKWIEYRDHETEKLLHDEYQKFALNMSNSEEDPTRSEFYRRLHSHLFTEGRSLGIMNLDGYSELGRWELAHLDQDGGTTKIETWTTRQWRTSLLSKEAWLKYGALAPEGFKPARFWTGLRGRDSRPAEPTNVVGLRPREKVARSRWVTSFNAYGNTLLTITTDVVGKRQTKHDSDGQPAQKKRH